jgi:catechol 2,3-dioxygenase-like lactoylglutathione lyase family enzyme
MHKGAAMIEGFEHVGMGVTDVKRSFDFYKNVLGFSMKLNEGEEVLEEMTPIIGESARLATIMAINLSSGAAIELIEHKSTPPRPLPDVHWGDIGYLAAGLKAYKIDELVGILEGKGAKFITPVIEFEVAHGGTWKSAFMRDPDGIFLELLETEKLREAGRKPRIGGFSHVTMGVSNMEKSIEFFKRVIGFDEVLFDTEETPPGLEPVTGGQACRWVTLRQGKAPQSPLPVEGGMVVLVEARGYEGKPIYEGRRWGDVGIMEMAVEIVDIESTYKSLVESGAEPYNPPTDVDMGMGSKGAVAYIKDPDGNSFEMVEAKKIGFLPPKVVGPLLRALFKIRSKF